MLRYVELINEPKLKTFVTEALANPLVCNCLSKPSTYAGNNHPQDEFIPSGLALHTARVCNIAIQMYRCFPDATVFEQDLIIAGSILHDVPYKFLVESGYPNHNHAVDNARWFLQEAKDLPQEIISGVASIVVNHMGKWNSSYDSLLEQYPVTRLSWVVHLADNIASRKNIFVAVDDVEYLKENLINE